MTEADENMVIKMIIEPTCVMLWEVLEPGVVHEYHLQMLKK